MRIECPYCHGRYDVASEYGGRNIVCGSCRKQIVAPYPVVGPNAGAVQVATKLPASLIPEKVNHKLWAVATLMTCGFALPFWFLNWIVTNSKNYDILKHQRQ